MSTRDDLVGSMADLMWDRGYAATSPRAVLDRAEAGQGSMYHHFRGGKKELALAAEQKLGDDAKAAFDARVGNGTARERLERYLGMDESILRGCRLGRLTGDPDVVTSPDLRSPIDEALREITDRLADILAGGVAAGELPKTLDIRATATAIHAHRQGSYVLARAAGDPSVMGAASEAFLDLLFTGDK